MKNFVSKYYEKISQTSFFRYNDFQANLILVLTIVLFIIVGIDWGTEMAKQKDEISHMVVTLTESLDFNNFCPVKSLIYIPQVIYHIHEEDIVIISFIIPEISRGRSPPLT
ncbi:MAG TPA: hypothetical protein PKD83_08910 [Ignavibacteria bacterium]|nr:hypothetical protein [Ignavibacteria bacterium]